MLACSARAFRTATPIAKRTSVVLPPTRRAGRPVTMTAAAAPAAAVASDVKTTYDALCKKLKVRNECSRGVFWNFGTIVVFNLSRPP